MTKLKNDIVNILCEDARITPARIASMLKTDAAAVETAIAELEHDGVIIKYMPVLNEEKLGKETVQALIGVKVSPMYMHGFDAIAAELSAFPEVRSLYLMSGGFDLTIIVEGRTLKEVALFVSEKLSPTDKVISTATHFILKKYKTEGVTLTGSFDPQRMIVHP